MEQQTLPSLSSFTCDWTYHVFLNFRAVDTRNNFTGNLYNYLQHQRGIQTFIDDEQIQKGDEITPTLQAIKESRIFIAIFSPNYASSTFCLMELVTILEFSKLQGRLFLPIFYDVDPSHVRNITGTYAEAFVKHEVRFGDEKEKVQKWRDALHQAANTPGWHFKPGSKPEYKFIKKIVKEVSIKINRVPLHVANNPVGLESRMLEVTSLLGLESGERVNMVGIYGIGGIGKSTTARAFHNLIADQFEGVCFLADIREREIHHGLVQLQETLLSEILGEKDIKVGDVYKGISIIKRRLKRKKVLLILDDVDKEKQLQALVGGHDWFGSGSKIIITTRDKHLLATHGIVNVYEVKQLENEKALDLFSWHAFKNKNIDPDYVNIAKRAVSYCHGLPLALEVTGSQLFGKSLAVWKSSLDKYERVIRKDIHEILKVSYDDLKEDVKGIFLDIACFFNSYDIGYVKEILYHHGFHAEGGIQELTDKSLMKIDTNGCVRMHDLIRDMGREIVRQESTLEPGRRSRLWFSDDIVHVLEENKGTDTIEVIIVDLHKDRKVNWCGDAFGQMKNLRILIIRNAQFSRGPQILPDSLRVLDWCGYQSSSLPSEFNPKNLAVMHLPESHIECFESVKVFHTLSSLNFEGCKFLIEVPSLSSVPNLGALCVDDCSSLIRIHDSVGFLDKLVSLSAQDCTQLESLVPSINLPSLVTLDLSGCSRLESFPEVVGVMENIKDVYLDHTSIKQLPSTIGNLVGLQRLFLRNCFQLPSYILPKVEIITTYGCRGLGMGRSLSRSPSYRRRHSRSRSPSHRRSRRHRRHRSRSSSSLSPPHRSRTPTLKHKKDHPPTINNNKSTKSQREEELKLLEEETARRIEEAIRKNVEEKLNSEEVKLEIERRVADGVKKLFDDVEVQLEKEKQDALTEARRKEEQARKEREELDKMLEENRRRVEESQRREALELQRKEEERQRELEMIRRQKEETARRKKLEDEEHAIRINSMGKNKSRANSYGL